MMRLVDWAARWNPVPDDRPVQVWLPAQRAAAPAAGTGGAPGLRAQLDALDTTPASCRAAVYGAPPAAVSASGPVPAPVDTAPGTRQTPVLPQQRRSQHVLHETDPRHVCRELDDGVDVVTDLRTRA